MDIALDVVNVLATAAMLWMLAALVRSVRSISTQFSDLRTHFDERHDVLVARIHLVERAAGLETHTDDQHPDKQRPSK